MSTSSSAASVSVESSAIGASHTSAVSKTYSLFHSSSQTTSIKLDRGNFLVWESVVLPLIEGNRLASHIDGTEQALSRFLSEGAEKVSNPEYDEWFATDRMLVGWLRNTMTQEVGAQLLHCRFARDLWVEARELTCASTKARVMVFKSELHSTRKNSMKMEEYLAKMKVISDQLALAGAPISTEELVMHTLNGLDSEYNAIVVKLFDQPSLTWVEAQSSLLAFESRLEQLSHFSSMTIQPTANFAQRSSGDNDRRGSNQNQWRNTRSFRGGRRGFRGRRNREGRPFCTFCDRPGHFYEDCYSRLRSTSNRGGNSYIPQAYYANTQTVVDPAWYMDSGSNYHVTSNSDSLAQINPIGKSHLLTCIGERTKVTSIGFAHLACSNSQLQLSDVVVVPNATKNLLIVNKLVKDNSVDIIITNDGCTVKDKVTGKILMHGKEREGVYPILDQDISSQVA